MHILGTFSRGSPFGICALFMEHFLHSPFSLSQTKSFFKMSIIFMLIDKICSVVLSKVSNGDKDMELHQDQQVSDGYCRTRISSHCEMI
jgi:hypothetical protein